jgi:hypothetical protein
MEKHIESVASLPLENNPITYPLIKKADLLPDPESRLDSMEMKEKPLM